MRGTFPGGARPSVSMTCLRSYRVQGRETVAPDALCPGPDTVRPGLDALRPDPDGAWRGAAPARAP